MLEQGLILLGTVIVGCPVEIAASKDQRLGLRVGTPDPLGAAGAEVSTNPSANAPFGLCRCGGLLLRRATTSVVPPPPAPHPKTKTLTLLAVGVDTPGQGTNPPWVAGVELSITLLPLHPLGPTDLFAPLSNGSVLLPPQQTWTRTGCIFAEWVARHCLCSMGGGDSGPGGRGQVGCKAPSAESQQQDMFQQCFNVCLQCNSSLPTSTLRPVLV